jgi:hypothetical protein
VIAWILAHFETLSETSNEVFDEVKFTLPVNHVELATTMAPRQSDFAQLRVLREESDPVETLLADDENEQMDLLAGTGGGWLPPTPIDFPSDNDNLQDLLTTTLESSLIFYARQLKRAAQVAIRMSPLI